MDIYDALCRLRDRYYRPVIRYPQGVITHHGDCNIHRSLEVYGHATCTCGLLHDLRTLEGYSDKLYPLQGQDEARQEMGPMFHDLEFRKRQADGEAEIFRMLKETGITAQVDTEHDDAEEWEMIQRVFGIQGAAFFQANHIRVTQEDFWEANL